MNKEEKEKVEKVKEDVLKQTVFDPIFLVGKNVLQMAQAYNVSESTYRRSIAAIRTELLAIKRKVRPGCKNGAQGLTYKGAVLIVKHLGKPKRW